MMKRQRKNTSTLNQMSESILKSHLQALFYAIENNHLEKARLIIETNNVGINHMNSDELFVLDLSVLNNNRPMTKMLLNYGAMENDRKYSENIGDKLLKLLKLSESEKKSLIANKSRQSSLISNLKKEPSFSGCSNNEIENCERRIKSLKRLLLGWRQIDPPNVPSSLEIGVNGVTSVFLKIIEPISGPITTKFKVQWSSDRNFLNLAGEQEFRQLSCTGGTIMVKEIVNELKSGDSYYFRGSCGNLKGWGPYKLSNPACIKITSWRNDSNEEKLNNHRLIDDLCSAFQLLKQNNLEEFAAVNNGTFKKPKRKNALKYFFSYPFKFQKNLKRSLYFASIIYNDDKILVTNDDFLPVIEIDECYPKNFQSDFCWIFKVSHYWEGIKALRMDLEQNIGPNFTFRAKLLTSICEMQSALGLLNLGTLYYKPIRDQNGAIVITSIQSVHSPKEVFLMNSKWISVRKIQESSSVSLEEHSISKKLILSLQDQIQFHQNLIQRLSPGLYVGYLNILCSIEEVKIIVPAETPNVLPHCKIRDNSFLTGEEWNLIKFGGNVNGNNDSFIMCNNTKVLTEAQTIFCVELINSIRKLFLYMDVKHSEHVLHRVYDIEVIELSKNVSFLIICPTVEFNSATSEAELLLQRTDLKSININVFEILHLYAYKYEILYKYARLSSMLEVETISATRSHREAFSSNELHSSKEKLKKLNEFAVELNTVWNSLRWMQKVISFARCKSEQSSEFMKHILGNLLNNNETCFRLQYHTQYHIQKICDNIQLNCISESSVYKNSSKFAQLHQSSVQTKTDKNQELGSLDIANLTTRKPFTYFKTKTDMTPEVSCKYEDSGIPFTRVKICYQSKDSKSNNINTSKSLQSYSESNCDCFKTFSNLKSNSNVIPKSYHGEGNSKKIDVSGIIQVFTAYNTGLASGTSLKLHVTINTTAREVINLVVKQLNMAIILRGSTGPIHEINKLHTFCLVAVIGARERCLRDDFRPLKLQNPWKKGRLYVRKKADLLAALEHYCQITHHQK